MDSIICEVVPSIRGENKLVVNGFLMVKDKTRNETYYWYCEKRYTLYCSARAITKLIGNQHKLKNVSTHNHAAEAARADVVKAISNIKEQAHQTYNKPSQIIQATTSQISQEVHSCLPTREALQQVIQRIRRSDLPKEPESLDNLVIPDNMLRTLDGVNFLVKDSVVGHNRILLFTTISNIRKLEQSTFWIMDETFKTVPNLFEQLYTIHGRVGGSENSRIFPLVYALMSSKSKECYEKLFQDLLEFSEDNEIDLQPQIVLTDFEVAAISAIQNEFQNVQCKGCHFHLAQSVYRKVQSTHLTNQYSTDENFSLLIRHIPALAFLPPREIPGAFDELKVMMPTEANELIQWFEQYYIRGRVRRIMRNGTVNRSEPLFPPNLWSVVDNIEYHIPRTQNSVEAWHRRWNTLLDNTHLGVFRMISELQKEQNQVQLDIECVLRGVPRPPQKRHAREREARIQTIYNDRLNRTVLEYLRGIAHNISF